MTAVLVQFMFRVSCGTALALLVTSPRLVNSGFFRVQLWVLLGCNTLAALATGAGGAATADAVESSALGPLFWIAIGLAVTSYVGAVLWLYEAARPGRVALALIAIASLIGASLAPRGAEATRGAAAQITTVGGDPVAPPLRFTAAAGDALTGGLLLGVTLTAMLLGHWYLNTPTMQLAPLRQLVGLTGIAVGLRAAWCAAGLWWLLRSGVDQSSLFWAFVGFRWVAGLAAVAWMAALTWQTLRIPNTQSATGILYAATVLVILGELVSRLLSKDALFPV